MLTDGVETELELLGRHIIILNVVIRKGPIGIMKLSEETGIPNHKVRYSLRALEHERLITPSTLGAVATDEVKEFIKNFDSVITCLRKRIDTIDILE
jgi:predicted transcriptional regulator